MKDSTSSPRPISKVDFKNHWKQLDDSDQELLQAMALAYQPLNLNQLLELIRNLQLRTEGRNTYSPNVLKAVILSLLAKGWLIEMKNQTYQVSETHLEWLMRIAGIHPNFIETSNKILNFFSQNQDIRSNNNTQVEALKRFLRIQMYTNNSHKVAQTLDNLYHYSKQDYFSKNIFYEMFNPFELRWLKTFSSSIQTLLLPDLIKATVFKFEDSQHLIDFIHQNIKIFEKEKTRLSSQNAPLIDEIVEALAIYHIMRAEWPKAYDIATRSDNIHIQSYIFATLSYLKGDFQDAATRYNKADNFMKKSPTHSTWFFKTFQLFTTIRITKGDIHTETLSFFTPSKKNKHQFVFDQLKDVLGYHRGTNVTPYENEDFEKLLLEWHMLFVAWTIYWNQYEDLPNFYPKLILAFEKAHENGYIFPASELAQVIHHILPNQPDQRYIALAQHQNEKYGIASSIDLFKIIPAWEFQLNNLLSLALEQKNPEFSNTGDFRLAYFLDIELRAIHVKEQKIGKSGTWTKGRSISLKRLKEDFIPWLADRDKEFKGLIARSNSSFHNSFDYNVNFDEAVLTLVGHPQIFLLTNPPNTISLIKKEPEIIIEPNKELFKMSFIPTPSNNGVTLVRETPSRYLVYKLTEPQLKISSFFNHRTLTLPSDAKDKLIQAAQSLSDSITVHTIISGSDQDMPIIKGDPKIYVHIIPFSEGFRIEFYVKPFTTIAPYFKPGTGRKYAITTFDNLKTIAERDLDLEIKAVQEVLDMAPVLASIPAPHYEWAITEVEGALTTMLSLQPLLESSKISIEYPKGQKLKIIGTAGFENIRLSASSKNNWFELQGELKIDEDRVIDFAQLLELTQKNENTFIEIRKGEYVALTQQLKEKLSEINALSQIKDDKVNIHNLTISVLEEISSELEEFKTDQKWKNTLAKINNLPNLQSDIPENFNANLRDYQLNGFEWLSQLAYWGVGACLADDMGLGKTIQALALILDRSNEGPALVVSPASVVYNWENEILKFAPTLEAIPVINSVNISAVIDNLRPGQVLIMSYGLMQSQQELLSQIVFSTLVLDEAQAIKNKATKRAKAALNLQANFKIATTGTPIENHLGELWSIFNFVNPGLLGSLKNFNQKFAIPIERHEDPLKRNLLKQILRPFILRRRKSEVLKELPPKTEVTLSVQLSDEEIAFYEAIRRRAIQTIDAKPNHLAKRFQVLAELTRLRQASCHPRMIDPQSTIPSSKLQLFFKTISDIIDNGHKVLVFSQFVKHLSLVRERLDNSPFSYQYLDGQTPLKKRQQAINAFQNGESDLFLISLKAGGTGLNLTAADYVIHMDPWWNPAVEDQASDRAHRIGQTNPVTIYRLVSQNTIEEKIVELHNHKRDLADSLLQGTNVSSRLDANQLLDLIKQV